MMIETYSHPDNARLHAAACQVKVFKLKGADRKHKQDREKIMKKTPVEQAKLQPSYECTVFSDVSPFLYLYLIVWNISHEEKIKVLLVFYCKTKLILPGSFGVVRIATIHSSVNSYCHAVSIVLFRSSSCRFTRKPL